MLEILMTLAGNNNAIAPGVSIFTKLQLGVYNTSQVYIDGVTYMFGGQEESPPGGATPGNSTVAARNVKIFDNLKLGTFRLGAVIPDAAGSGNSESYAFIHDNEIYFWPGISGGQITKLYHYNRVTDTFTLITTAPGPIGDGPALAYYEGRFYIFTVNSNIWMQYTFQTNTWVTNSNQPFRKLYSRAAACGNKIYIATGYDYAVSGDTSTTVDVVDITTNVWSKATPIPLPSKTGLRAGGFIELNDQLFYYGGFGTKAGVKFSSNTLYVYDIKTTTWRTISNVGQGGTGTGGMRYNDTVMFIGGRGRNSPATTTNLVIQCSNN